MKLVDRVKAIMFTPRTEWPVIAEEPGGMTGLYVGYVAVLAAIPEVANFIGQSLIGAYKPIGAGLLRAAVVYLVTFAVVYFVAVVIDVLAPRFGGKKSWPNAFKLSVYSHTPLWLSGIFLLIPGLSFLAILGGAFGFYLLWVGLPLLMAARSDQALVYAVVVIACALIPAVVLSLV
jgi:Yip1 domain